MRVSNFGDSCRSPLLDHIRVLRTGGRVEYHNLVGGFYPAIAEQTAQGCDARGAFGAKEDTFSFSHRFGAVKQAEGGKFSFFLLRRSNTIAEIHAATNDVLLLVITKNRGG